TMIKPKPNSKDFLLKLQLNRGEHSISLKESNEAVLSIWEQPKKRSKELITHTHRTILKIPKAENPSDNRSIALANIKDFASRAFRRPINEVELARLMKLYDRAVKRGDPYEESIKLALKAILVSPHFLFRIEQKPHTSEVKAISSFELASRLSYFLWGSLPDDELFTLAKDGRLQNTKVLIAQTQRMLNDPKADFFYRKFTGQWLGTKDVGLSVSPNIRGIGYTTKLGTDLREEPNQLFKFIVREDRSLLELISADYVIINENLAKHYGIEGIAGETFRHHKLMNHQRGGILGLGGVHMVTSFRSRTSPVLRGVWVIETILGTPIPPPPDNVPELKVKKHHRKKTIRQIFESHRENAACAACHNLIDPIGFGLENYDLIGKWRTEENGMAVDSTGTLPSGESFNGPQEFKKLILKQKDNFARHLISKMLGYALGRSLIDQDAGSIERILNELKSNNYSSKSLIRSIVLSVPFRNNQKTKERTKYDKH
ncbi:MAG: DUF1592 domain-containing protein, partial [Lentisphaeraceae bacterium]|nr:DUF1592 domain-containing protein [Lentisphaeraceae bacterium]